jgi:hypothetical protein
MSVELDGEAVRLKDAVGLHDLAHLLAHPNQGFLASTLFQAVRGSAATDAERTRSAVSKRIRASMARIAAQHPGLGLHLRACIHTGYVCAYCPDPTQPLRGV